MRTPKVAPINWASTKSGTDRSAIPLNVLVKPLANVTAGLAKDVEDVKKLKGEICKSKAIFGRKFTKEAAEKIAMSC